MYDELPNFMTRLSRLASGFVLGAVLWSALVPVALGQETRTLTIRDGAIFVDGQQLSAEQVPSDLNLNGVTTRYRFVGVKRPVIELNGQLYAVENGLRAVSEEEINAQESSVILQEIAAGRTGPRSASASAQEAQRQYLNEVQKANRKLYKRLVRERSMEQQAQDVARVIQLLPEGSDERRAKVDTLRSLLNEIFELKQENRRREIERLQREIQKVQRSLQKRKRMREAMIDHRLSQLINASAGR